MAKRKPLVFIAGEIVENKASDTLDGNNISVLSTGSNTERLLKDRFNDIINVKDYGAKGNGITDDTAAFQTAVSVAEQKNSVIYVPYGVYNISEPVEGEFISFGHPIITGNGSVTFLLDLFDDLVHKTNSVNETITGDKTFTNKVIFDGSVDFKDPLNLNEAALTSLAEALLTPENNGFTALTNTNGKLRVNADEFIKANSGLATELQNNIKKLKIDLSNANTETLNKITSYLIKPNSGLSVDPTTKKLQVDFQDITIDQLIPLVDPDGGIVVNEDSESEGYGKLKINFASMDPAIMRDVVYAMTQEGGGLDVDDNGQLFVNFSKMPTDKFDVMLASLRMQTPLSANKYLYVDNVLGSDTITVDDITRSVDIIDNHGSSSKPFATIGACIKYATSKYAIGEYSLVIRIITNYDDSDNKIPYEENLTLPTYNRTSGAIRLVGYTTKIVDNQTVIDSPVIKSPSGSTRSLIYCTGGKWYTRNLDIQCAVEEPQNPTENLYISAIKIDGAETDFTLQGCNVQVEMIGTPSRTAEVSVISVESGQFTFGLLSGYHNELTCLGGNSTRSIFIFGRNASIQMPSGNPSSYATTDCVVACSGTADLFLNLVQNSNFAAAISTDYYRQSFSGSPTVTKQYSILSGSGCIAPSTGFPGTDSGTTDSTTFSWYTITT